MSRIPTHRAPTHPGEMLLEEFLVPSGITQRELADGIHVPFQRVNEIVNGRRGITPATALRFARFFGMSAEFWMNLQQKWDLNEALSAESKELKSIRPYEMLVAEQAPPYQAKSSR
jgi:addiction module HigA family antidote